MTTISPASNEIVIVSDGRMERVESCTSPLPPISKHSQVAIGAIYQHSHIPTTHRNNSTDHVSQGDSHLGNILIICSKYINSMEVFEFQRDLPENFCVSVHIGWNWIALMMRVYLSYL